jgi:hypothetical protein
MKTANIITASASSLSIRVKLAMSPGTFAALRLSESSGYTKIRDGRSYGTENRMRANRSSRPESARMFRVVAWHQNHLVELEELA